MSIWLNALSALILISGTGDVSETDVNPSESEVACVQESGYVVVESVEDDVVILETDKGNIVIPSEVLPENLIKEGLVIEWRIADEEAEKRLQEGQSRIDRLEEMSER